ncbi:hypothetical protein [Ureibacillus manganicus]|uniref:Uncharacterized protein n=1 Tax=Ureibacillus manganicus DSM 26584 TaxID=1384049 RepID=A0A0A3HSW8_9BACL|nr:hypothetical protein [Ureibacillus manganicus]KGR75691.1 hypothetical protein CD29_17820 [Ureibacillus manganicus DSM 26584]
MLDWDEKIYKETAGKIGEPIELAIRNLSDQDNIQNTSQFGTLIPLSSILLTKEKALNIVSNIAKKYWGNIDLFLFEKLQDTSIDLNNANERLTHFFSSRQGKKALLQYLTIHNVLRFDHLINLVFGKEIEITNHVGGLNCIYFYKVEKKFFIHIIYNQKETFWKTLFVKKIYSIFLQTPMLSINDSLDLIRQLQAHLEQLHTSNKSISVINQLINVIAFNNPRSFQLKELQLFNVINHYKGGKRHRQKISRIIEDMYNNWVEGTWALSEKEQTILKFMLVIDAYKQEDFESIIAHGEYLIQNDRLNNHAIELILEYGEVLPNIKPEPIALIKRYNKNYIEKIFYILIEAYIQKHQYEHVIRLLKEYEIASCTAIYNYLNQDVIDDGNSLHHIEATVQRDIIFIVDHTPQHIMHSVEVWLNHYQDEDSPYYEIAIMSSKHICNILKALFATEHFELFDKLMEVYAKYIKVDAHFHQLRDFAADYVKI